MAIIKPLQRISCNLGKTKRFLIDLKYRFEYIKEYRLEYIKEYKLEYIKEYKLEYIKEYRLEYNLNRLKTAFYSAR